MIAYHHAKVGGVLNGGGGGGGLNYTNPVPTVRVNIHPPVSAPVVPALAPVQRPAPVTPPHPLQASLD